MTFKLEDYLRKNRPDLDVESPDDASVWEKVRKRVVPEPGVARLSTGKPVPRRLLNIAAILLLFFSLGYIFNDILNHHNNNVSLTLSTFSKELGRREKEYQSFVDLKTEEARSSVRAGDIAVSELFAEIARLDTLYSQVLADLKELGPAEKVVNTLFDIYEQKLRLLELIILETDKTNNRENHEKIAL